MAARKRGGGRPSSYRPEFATQAEKLCKFGATDIEIADFFGVAQSTFYKWRNEHSEFSEALKVGKEVADERVVKSLYHRAVGYTFESEKVFQFQGQIVRASTREHVAPDTTACIFWLKNRRKDEWRDRTQTELTGKDGDPVIAILREIDGQTRGLLTSARQLGETLQ